jgi:integrase/recombinase XerD
MLTDAVKSYVALRRAMGFELRDLEARLLSFARFAAARDAVHVRSDVAIAWASVASSPRERAHRLNEVIRFSIHVHAEDPAHEVPPRNVFGDHPPRRRVPFIFSREDVVRLVRAASELGPPGSLRPHSYSTLFALLSCTGLRISEALHLRMADVTDDGLVVRQTKFKKTRLVPLHPSAAEGLKKYLRLRRLVRGNDDHVFVAQNGRPICHRTVLSHFMDIVRALGLHPGPGKWGPRLHDLRHTFAVHALESCPPDRERVGVHLVALSTYMGHSHFCFTYWYLQATPYLLSDIRDAVEVFAGQGAP